MEKFSRGFDELIYIWGADHHGTVARLKNAAQALGFDRDAVNVLLIAWVRFVRDGEEVSMSKRSGEFVTPRRAARRGRRRRGALVSSPRAHRQRASTSTSSWRASSRAKTRSITSSTRTPGSARSCARPPTQGCPRGQPLEGALADDDVALGLAKDLLRLPDIVRDAAAARETQSITAFATELATKFHAFYRDRRVVDASRSADLGVSASRSSMRRASHSPPRSRLLGISAPDSM